MGSPDLGGEIQDKMRAGLLLAMALLGAISLERPVLAQPAGQCSKVDFPEPEGPITAVNDPAGISILTPSSAVTAAWPEP